MFILRDLLRPLQAHFSDTDLGLERSSLFAYTLLAVIVPFTSSMTSNLLRSVVTLFGIDIKKKRFYTFMASSTLPWQKLWHTVWGLIPSPETNGRLLVALDDFINPKTGCVAITYCMPNLTPRSLDNEAVAVSTVNAWDRPPT